MKVRDTKKLINSQLFYYIFLRSMMLRLFTSIVCENITYQCVYHLSNLFLVMPY